MALTAIIGEKMIAELAEQFDVHPNQITQWRTQLLEGDSGVFGADAPPAADVISLHAKIGELTRENDFLSRDLALMRRIDELHLERPFAGSRMVGGLLQAEGREPGRLHVSTLMKQMPIDVRWSPFLGQFRGVAKLGSGPRHAAA